MRPRSVICALLVALAIVPVGAEARLTDAIQVKVGHWLDLSGRFGEDGRFHADEAEILQPQRYDVLVGNVESVSRKGAGFSLLGREIVTTRDTRWRIDVDEIVAGMRVKVRGRYMGRSRLRADRVSSRGAGRDHIGGRVDRVVATAEGLEVRVLRYTVVLPARIEHQDPLYKIDLAPIRFDTRAFETRQEDDLFGTGLQITDTLRFVGQAELSGAGESDFDLDAADSQDRTEFGGALRLRLEWVTDGRLASVIELRRSDLYRDEQDHGAGHRGRSRMGQTFVFVQDVLVYGADLQIGRQDFDEPREWIYDQNLDGVRLHLARPHWRLEASMSTTLGDGRIQDTEATNLIAYVSNNDRRRHAAFWVVHRDKGDTLDEVTTHVGVRALGRWLPDNKSWFELAMLRGSRMGVDQRGWALDAGTTWSPEVLGPFSLTFGYAFGSGDGSPGATDRTFRQTGLQDNNDKFAGVTSFRYYGELVDPELSNLEIVTVGLGARWARRSSVDLVYHRLRQDEAVPGRILGQLKARADGIHPNLGWEVDLVVGDRRWERWDFEAVVAYFDPGSAFGAADRATLGRLQVRFRF